jgi:hypothetical protein
MKHTAVTMPQTAPAVLMHLPSEARGNNRANATKKRPIPKAVTMSATQNSTSDGRFDAPQWARVCPTSRKKFLRKA